MVLTALSCSPGGNAKRIYRARLCSAGTDLGAFLIRKTRERPSPATERQSEPLDAIGNLGTVRRLADDAIVGGFGMAEYRFE